MSAAGASPKHSKFFPVFVTLVIPALAIGVSGFGVRRNFGPRCDADEQFVEPGRPVHRHRCACLGLRRFESPPETPGSNATRCLGWVRRRWTETNEAAREEWLRRQSGTRRSFETLAPEAQERVLAAHRLLRQAAQRRDYSLMLQKAREILLEVDDFGETRALEAVASRALATPAP